MLKASQQVETPVEQMSVPRCLVAMGQALNRVAELVIKGLEPDWNLLEGRLVAIITAVYRPAHRKKPSRLAQGVKDLLRPAAAPDAASP
jgi:hypothetical protein